MQLLTRRANEDADLHGMHALSFSEAITKFSEDIAAERVARCSIANKLERGLSQIMAADALNAPARLSEVQELTASFAELREQLTSERYLRCHGVPSPRAVTEEADDLRCNLRQSVQELRARLLNLEIAVQHLSGILAADPRLAAQGLPEVRARQENQEAAGDRRPLWRRVDEAFCGPDRPAPREQAGTHEGFSRSSKRQLSAGLRARALRILRLRDEPEEA